MNDDKPESTPENRTGKIPLKRVVMPFDRLKHCTCGEDEGCTDNCDRNMTFWEVAVEEARSLPPGSRDNTLDWVLLRIHELQVTPRCL